MTYLSSHIEALAKKKATKSLIVKHSSCGILQEYDQLPLIAEKRTEL